MPIFEKPPLATLAPAKDRWTPIYLEHGRLEVDDSSVKWIGADRLVYRLPVATISAIMLGPGTTVTHAAMKACADSNTPLCWIGEDGMRFYAFGITPNHDNSMPRKHASAWADKKKRAEIARRMFSRRFPGVDVQGHSVRSCVAWRACASAPGTPNLALSMASRGKAATTTNPIGTWPTASTGRCRPAMPVFMPSVQPWSAHLAISLRWDSSTMAQRCRSTTMAP